MTHQINPFLQLRILILLVIFSSIFITTKSFSQITQEDIQTLTSGEIALPVKKAILGSYSFAKDSPSDFKAQLQQLQLRRARYRRLPCFVMKLNLTLRLSLIQMHYY